MTDTTVDIANMMQDMGRAARAAASELSATDNEQRNTALQSIAATLRAAAESILLANANDLHAAEKNGQTDAMLDRLMLDHGRIDAMANAVEAVAALPQSIGTTLAEWTQPNGLRFRRVSVPLGVIGIIYESRPNVTVDAAALCLKSGNAVILRGGSESFRSCTAIHDSILTGLRAAELPAASVQLIPTRKREAVGYLLSSMGEWLDVVVPRGGKSLIKRVQDEARVPVIGHLEGICHVYLHSAADAKMAEEVVLNAKMRRTGICGAAETILVDQSIVEDILPRVCEALRSAGCEIRGDATVQAQIPGVIAAVDKDWSTEYLDAIVSIRVVADSNAAIEHIAQFGSGHTDSIITDDEAAAEQFLRAVDSAIVLHNASTQYADGGEFGMGAEIGIATGRIHARGPVGANQLTSYKYVVHGKGHLRP